MGIRLKIIISFATILFTAMFLMSTVMLYLSHRIFHQLASDKGKMIGQMLIRHRFDPDNLLSEYAADGISSQVNYLLQEGELLAVCIMDKRLRGVIELGNAAEVSKLKKANIGRVLQKGKEEIFFLGSSWDFFPKTSLSCIITLPIEKESEITGIIALSVPLWSTLRHIATIQQFLILYLIVNTIIFTILGYFRVSGFTLKPIGKLIYRATEYRDGDGILLPYEGGGSEWDTLSRAVNRIVELNMKDKKMLSETVASLKVAMDKLQTAQQEILQAEKLATVGRLASGIAHEIGNPIGIIIGYLELIQQPCFSDCEKEDLIQRTVVQVRRIDQIIRQLLDFSRPTHKTMQKISIHESLQEVIEMTQLLPIFSGINMDSAFAANIDLAVVDSNQIQQAFLNLMMNSADAIQNCKEKHSDQREGKISIATENVFENTGDSLSQPASLFHPWIKIIFRDNGEGIDKVNLQKIFDPFFTTKPPGKGTGLGLWVSLLIVEGFGGRIKVDSVVGEGTTLMLYLPAVHKESIHGLLSDGDDFQWKRT